MKRKYKAEWYEYELTKPCCRKFFTEFAAVVFAYFIGKWQNAKVKISGI